MTMVAALVGTALPQKVSASSDYQAGVKYIYQDDDPSNIRTGIESVKMDGITYYDLEGGRGETTPETGNEYGFYKKVLTSTPVDSDKTQLSQWAEVAEAVFEDNAYYSADINASGSFAENFGSQWGKAGYTDISQALASQTGSQSGEKSCDYTVVSGLSYANHLTDVRQKCCDQIVSMIDTYSLDNEYSGNKKTFYEHTAGDNTLKALNNDTNQDVLYTMVTCIDEEGGTYAYHYNTFVLAFYDFKLAPLAGNGLEYISSVEGYDSIDKAAAAKVRGLSYSVNDKDNEITSYYKNTSTSASTVSLQHASNYTQTASTTMTNTDTYNYQETIGYEVKFKTAIPVLDTEHTIKFGFTAGQTFSTATSDSKTVSNSTSNTVTSSVTLPAHTAVELENSTGTTDLSVDFQCPVAITYKVAITSMSGKLYADRAATMAFKTAGYTQKTFSTIFGSDDAKGGTTAYENLYLRAGTNYDSTGYEATYGNTYGYRNRHGGEENTINALNWNSILGESVVIDPGEVNYSIIYEEVDKDGKATGKILNSLDGKQSASSRTGYDDYEVEESVPASYTYTQTDSDGKETDTQYSIYTGKVYDSNGNELDNTFRDKSKLSKSIILSKNNNNLYFYYRDSSYPPVVEEASGADTEDDTQSTVTEGDSQAEITEDDSQAAEAENDSQTEDATPSTEDVSGSADGTVATTTDTASVAASTKNQLRDIIAWISSNVPMSSTGSTLNYTSKAEESRIGEVIPLYPLAKIYMDNTLKFGDLVVSSNGTSQYIGTFYDADDFMDFTMYYGDKFLTKNVTLGALNTKDVAYYGFKDFWGHWEAVKDDGNGNWIPDTSTDVAQLLKDSITGNQYVLAGNKEGTYYIKYVMDEGKYKSLDQTDYATNSDVSTPVIRINIKKAPFTGTVSLSGSYTGTVNSDPVKLEDVLNVFVANESGDRVEKDISWEAKEKNGISITSDGEVTFTKAGSYQVRAIADGVYSDWVTIQAKELPVLSKITFQAPDFRKAEVTLTSTNSTLSYDLPSYLKYYDQYGNSWTGDLPDVTFSMDYNAGGSISGKTLKVTKEGTYKVYASASGYSISPITITVSDDRKVGSITVSGSFSTKLGEAAKDLDSYLKVTLKDSTGKEVRDNYTWDVQELNGIAVTSDGIVTPSKAGTYHVRAVSSAGQYSDWHAISVTSYAPFVIANVKKSGKSIQVSWTKLPEASGYELYGTKCGSKKYTLIKTLSASKLSYKVSKIAGKSLKGSCYRFYVRAFKKVNGKKVYLCNSYVVHQVYKSSKKYANATSVTIKGNKTLKKGQSLTLKASVKLPKGKKQLNHVAAVRYLSSNPYIASVNGKGKVTAKAQGTAYVYAISVCGKCQKVKITVQ